MSEDIEMVTLWQDAPRDVVLYDQNGNAIPFTGLHNQELYTGLTSNDTQLNVPGFFMDMSCNVFAAYRTYQYLIQARAVTHDILHKAGDVFTTNTVDALMNLSQYETPELLDRIRESKIPNINEVAQIMSINGVYINPFSITYEQKQQQKVNPFLEKYLQTYSDDYLALDGIHQNYLDAITYFFESEEIDDLNEQKHNFMLDVASEYATQAEVGFPLALSRAVMVANQFEYFMNNTGGVMLGLDNESTQIAEQLTNLAKSVQSYKQHFETGIIHTLIQNRDADVMAIFHQTLKYIVETGHDIEDAAADIEKIRPDVDTEFIEKIRLQGSNIAKVVNKTLQQEMPNIYTYNQPFNL